MTATGRDRSNKNLIKGISPDPAVAERQKAHLRPGANAQHNAYSQAVREPLERQYRDAQRQQYPRAPDTLVNTLARRMSMAHLFGAQLDDQGVMQRRKGVDDVAPAARELRLLLEAIDRAVLQLEQYNETTTHTAAHLQLLRARGELPPAAADSIDGDLVDDGDGD